MPLDLTSLEAAVAANEVERKRLLDEAMAQRAIVLAAAIAEVGKVDEVIRKLEGPVPPTPFVESDASAKASKKKSRKAPSTDANRRGITKVAMWNELRRFFQENGPLTRAELWDLADEYCEHEGINLGVRMVFDRTVDDPKFAKEFCDLFNREDKPKETITRPQPSVAASI